MAKSSQHAEAVPNNYVVLLDKGTKAALRAVEKEFNVRIATSDDLSSEVRSFHILSQKNSVFYKNIHVVVMQNVDPEHLMHALHQEASPVCYFEKEKMFVPVNSENVFNALKTHAEALQSSILELEELLLAKPGHQPVAEMEWGLKAIGLEKTQYTGSGIDICILDTGFDISHPDFANRDIEGKSFVQGEDWNRDVHGHGTHCAGTAAGNKRLDNGKRYGVATGSNIKIAKVLSDSGTGCTSSIVDAIDWAITKKFRVISLSLGSPARINEKPSVIFEKSGEKALESNCLIIAASGNNSSRPSLPKPVSFPANSMSIMAVAAIDDQFRVARFSNAGINASTGGAINVCAPGVDVLSAYPVKSNESEHYALLNGTSMATPHVAGLAAILMEANPHLDAFEIWKLIEQYAQPLENTKFRDVGNGLIKATP